MLIVFVENVLGIKLGGSLLFWSFSKELRVDAFSQKKLELISLVKARYLFELWEIGYELVKTSGHKHEAVYGSKFDYFIYSFLKVKKMYFSSLFGICPSVLPRFFDK